MRVIYFFMALLTGALAAFLWGALYSGSVDELRVEKVTVLECYVERDRYYCDLRRESGDTKTLKLERYEWNEMKPFEGKVMKHRFTLSRGDKLTMILFGLITTILSLGFSFATIANPKDPEGCIG